MKLTEQLAKNILDLHFGDSWTGVNLKDTLAGIDWISANRKFYSFNTIAALIFHIHYYFEAVLKVFKGGPLEAHDRYSFDLPEMNSESDWQALLARVWTDAEELASLIGQFPDSRLEEDFADPKYGSYFRNICGLAEHSHYHLGQIVLIRKLLTEFAAEE